MSCEWWIPSNEQECSRDADYFLDCDEHQGITVCENHVGVMIAQHHMNCTLTLHVDPLHPAGVTSSNKHLSERTKCSICGLKTAHDWEVHTQKMRASV